MSKIKCPICGNEINDENYRDCRYCGWEFIGCEFAEDEDGTFKGSNPVSIAEAKRLVADGKNIWGEPLSK